MTTTSKVEAAYINAHATANELVDKIKDLLSDCTSDTFGVHWDHVGNLLEVNARLAEVVKFLGGTRDE